MFVHKPRNRIARSMEISVQEIAKNAFLGALIVATLGGLAGFLIGRGTLPMAGLEPGSVTLNPMFLTASIVSGIVVGGLIGALLGAASRLLRSREKAEVMTREIEKDGVLVTVNVINPQSETTARGVMEQHGAVDVGNPSEKWDLNSWISPNESNPSLANTR